MTSSTPITEGNELVTKNDETEVVDVWADKPSPAAPNREFLTVTLKAGTGYDAPWLVFHTSSVPEALEALQHSDLDELMDLTARKGKDLAKAFGGSQMAAKPSAGGGWGNKTSTAQSTPAGAVEWDADEGEYTCAHGGATQVKGESAKGPWTGYFCSQPKDAADKCTPKFLNKKR